MDDYLALLNQNVESMTMSLIQTSKFQSETKKTLVKAPDEFKINLSNYIKIADVYLMVIISYLDLISSVNILHRSNVVWDKVFAIKNIYLTIFETKNKVASESRILEKEVEESGSIECRSILKKIKTNKKKIEVKKKKIADIRNKIAGHIDLENYMGLVSAFDEQEAHEDSEIFLRMLDLYFNLFILLEPRMKLKTRFPTQ